MRVPLKSRWCKLSKLCNSLSPTDVILVSTSASRCTPNSMPSGSHLRQGLVVDRGARKADRDDVLEYRRKVIADGLSRPVDRFEFDIAAQRLEFRRRLAVVRVRFDPAAKPLHAPASKRAYSVAFS